MGWEPSRGNLWEVAPGKSIGGDVFRNFEQKVPEKRGRTWFEADINYRGGKRGKDRASDRSPVDALGRADLLSAGHAGPLVARINFDGADERVECGTADEGDAEFIRAVDVSPQRPWWR